MLSESDRSEIVAIVREELAARSGPPRRASSKVSARPGLAAVHAFLASLPADGRTYSCAALHESFLASEHAVASVARQTFGRFASRTRGTLMATWHSGRTVYQRL